MKTQPSCLRLQCQPPMRPLPHPPRPPAAGLPGPSPQPQAAHRKAHLGGHEADQHLLRRLAACPAMLRPHSGAQLLPATAPEALASRQWAARGPRRGPSPARARRLGAGEACLVPGRRRRSQRRVWRPQRWSHCVGQHQAPGPAGPCRARAAQSSPMGRTNQLGRTLQTGLRCCSECCACCRAKSRTPRSRSTPAPRAQEPAPARTLSFQTAQSRPGRSTESPSRSPRSAPLAPWKGSKPCHFPESQQQPAPLLPTAGRAAEQKARREGTLLRPLSPGSQSALRCSLERTRGAAPTGQTPARSQRCRWTACSSLGHAAAGPASGRSPWPPGQRSPRWSCPRPAQATRAHRREHCALAWLASVRRRGQPPASAAASVAQVRLAVPCGVPRAGSSGCTSLWACRGANVVGGSWPGRSPWPALSPAGGRPAGGRPRPGNGACRAKEGALQCRVGVVHALAPLGREAASCRSCSQCCAGAKVPGTPGRCNQQTPREEHAPCGWLSTGFVRLWCFGTGAIEPCAWDCSGRASAPQRNAGATILQCSQRKPKNRPHTPHSFGR